MNFFVSNTVPQILDRELVYVEKDYEFNTPDYPEPIGACSSVCINYLQLRMDDQALLYYVWGHCPLTVPLPTSAYPLNFEDRMIGIVVEDEVVPGVSHRVNWDGDWPIYVNKKEGWVCLGDPNTEDKQLIHFAPGAVAALEGDQLRGLWLKPKELPQSVLDLV